MTNSDTRTISLERQCGNQNRAEDIGFSAVELENIADFWDMTVDELLDRDECEFDWFLFVAEKYGV